MICLFNPCLLIAFRRGINLDVFTLLAVSNSALGHVLAGGLAALHKADGTFSLFSLSRVPSHF